MAIEIDKLQRLLGAAEKDARRYHFIKDEILEYKPAGYDGCLYGRFDGWWKSESNDLDALVDEKLLRLSAKEKPE
jgi:hypothetical protein